MAYLFELQNNVATPTTETLLISPYKEIWERDKSKNKEIAIKEFTYIELMTSKKKTNPFGGYSDEDRHKKLTEMLFNKTWKPDKNIELGMAKINELQVEASPTYSYYLSVLEGAEKMKKFFKDFDINEVNDKGTRIFKPNDIVIAIANTEKVLSQLNSMKEKVQQELFESTRTKANKTIGYFED